MEMLLGFGSALIIAAYSAPLTRVHIDTDEVHHTPQLVYVSDESAGGPHLQLRGQGVQYVLQIDRAAGFGAQLSGGVGRAAIDVTTLFGTGELTGLLYGGQARVYAELVHGGGGARPHALTVFVNFRAVHYGGDNGQTFAFVSASQTQLSTGVGLMAELVLGSHVSVLPYAWFSPSLMLDKQGTVVDAVAARLRDHLHVGPSLTRPLRVGIDLWLYLGGASSRDPVSLSFITSLIDTSGNGTKETSVVLGYTL